MQVCNEDKIETQIRFSIQSVLRNRDSFDAEVRIYTQFSDGLHVVLEQISHQNLQSALLTCRSQPICENIIWLGKLHTLPLEIS